MGCGGCNRAVGQEMAAEGGKLHAALAHDAAGRELGARKQCEAFNPVHEYRKSKSVVNTRRALTWELVGGKENVKARSVAKGYQDPALRGGGVDTPGCASLRSSGLEFIFLGAPKSGKSGT